MRLPNNISRGVAAFGLSIALAGCTLLGGGDGRSLAAQGPDPELMAAAKTGPAADYPMVLGETFTVDGITYTPADTLNYDHVGYASSDTQGGDAITVAHRTLPVPSYVEVTSLETGRTILARIERRGPMTGNSLLGLSPGAQLQLGAKEGTPIRVRRTNPPESQRAELRQGRAAPERMAMPQSLIAALKRKLPETGSASLRSAAADRMRAPQQASAPAKPVTQAKAEEKPKGDADFAAAMKLDKGELPATAAKTPPAKVAALPKFAATPPMKPAPPATARAGAAKTYPLPPLDGARPVARTLPISSPRIAGAVQKPKTAAQAPVAAVPVSDPKTGEFVIQAAAFANQKNAAKAASKLGGFVTRAGRFYRVRTGPFITRGQAEAALAKVRNAGYSDARVMTAG